MASPTTLRGQASRITSDVDEARLDCEIGDVGHPKLVGPSEVIYSARFGKMGRS